MAAGSLKNNDIYPPRDGVGWSENAARQLVGARTFRLCRVSEDKGVRSCLRTHVHHASLIDQGEPVRPKVVRAKHAASLIVVRMDDDAARCEAGEPHVLMGMRGAKHRFMPNRLVFPGGRVDRADLGAADRHAAVGHTERALRKNTNAKLARGLALRPRANCWRKPAYRSASRRGWTDCIIWRAL